MNWIDSLDRKFGRHSIPHLMYFITGVMLAVYVTDLVLGGQVSAALYFDRSLILRGEVWRLVTFLFLPPNSSPIWILFSLYFYCLIGNGLESAWGSFRFNIFYLVGVLGAVCSGLITGYAANGCLHMSLFLAFAAIYPDPQVRVAFPEIIFPAAPFPIDFSPTLRYMIEKTAVGPADAGSKHGRYLK